MLLSFPLGRWMAWTLAEAHAGVRQRLDRVTTRIVGRRAAVEQGWRGYVLSMLAFNGVMLVVSWIVLRTQGALPLNPDGHASLHADLALHTAVSFTTNTNLQHYAGEQQLSYCSQIVVVLWLQFVSAATGIAVLAALCRALSGRPHLGNYFRDMARALLLILTPFSMLLAVALLLCGVPMTFEGAATATTLEGAVQRIARGPVAAIVAIKQIGTNGGGYFGPNSAHPFENPTFLSNILENIAILALPMAAVWMFGHLVGSRRQAAAVFAVMAALSAGLAVLAVVADAAPAKAIAGLPVETATNLEGKELRFGASAGAFWAASTTATSNGSVNAMHNSLQPLAGLAPLTGMWLNVAFGGVGVGFINMFLFIVTTVFIAGMMVGRTPEYLGRKVEAREMQLALAALLLHPLLILGGSALFAATSWGRDTVLNPGSRGFTEIVYEFSSAAANNGSGYEGLADDTAPWNLFTAAAMLLGRFVPIVLPLAIAGSLAAKRRVAESAGTLRTDSALFGAVLLGVVLIVGALLFLPLALLGPIAEHLAVAPGGSVPGGITP